MVLGGKLPGRVGRCQFSYPVDDSSKMSRLLDKDDFMWLHGQAVKTPPFHGGNPGSIPGGVTKDSKSRVLRDFTVLMHWGSLVRQHVGHTL